MKRNLLYIVNYDISLPLTGAPLRSREIIRFLSMSYKVHVVGMTGCSHPPGRLEEEFKDRSRYKTDDLQLKVDVGFSKFGHFIFSRSIYHEAIKLMKMIRFDLIFADYLSSSVYGYLLSRRYNVPWIYSSHNVEHIRFFEFARDDFKRYFVVPYYYIVERLGARADVVVVISEGDAKIFGKWVNSERLVVIPQGFDEKSYRPLYKQTSTDRPIILFYGNYNHLPNRQAAKIIYNQILPEVVRRVPGAVFRFVGASPPLEMKHPNLEILGFVEDLSKEVQQAKVVIAPIIQGGGMRTKIIESLACGKTVISTRKGAEGFSDEHSNLIIAEIENFPNSICSVLAADCCENRCDYEKLKNNFSWGAILPKMQKKIERVIFSGEA
jgi:glycosyltransferase involved in cell wall biosynthesis